MLQFMLERRRELQENPHYRATGVHTNGVGSNDNTAHLNRTSPMEWLRSSAPSKKHAARPKEKKATVYTDITLRRAAATRELTDLGLRPYDIAVLLQCDLGMIYGYLRKFNIPWTRRKSHKDAWLTRLILRDFGKPGMTSKIMAERYGTSQNCISASICRLRNAGKLPPSMHSRAKPANIDQHQPASHA